jgi:hypothetical protein
MYVASLHSGLIRAAAWAASMLQVRSPRRNLLAKSSCCKRRLTLGVRHQAVDGQVSLVDEMHCRSQVRSPRVSV